MRRRPKILDTDGVVGQLRGVRVAADDHVVAIAELADGYETEVPFELLHHDEGDGYVLRARWADFPLVSANGAVIPVIEERVRTTVRRRTRSRVRVRRRVVTETRVVETPIWRERFEVERVPIDEIVTSPPAARRERDVLVVPCVEEIAVVEKRYRIREELRIRVVREQDIDRQTVTLRRHEIDVDGPTTDNPEGEHS